MTQYTTYEQVFHMPFGLLAKRGHEHAFNLKHGTHAVSDRPYIYPQS